MICTAHKSNGEPCKQWAIKGATVCRAHGGAAPRVKNAAKRRRQETAAAKAMQTYGAPIDVGPIEAMLNEIRWTAGHVEWLRVRVQELEPDEMAFGVAEVAEKGATEFPGTDTTRKAAPSVWVVLYQAERKHLVDVCEKALRIGLDERRVRIAEEQGRVLADVLRTVFADPELGLTAEQQQSAPTIFARHLRLLQGGAA